tara:strand:+ start:1274 stop:1606 length:333 start_codon:yes stop_codon:yes gene_type:complete
MNKEQAIKQVDECISSIFSKEDVKQIINKVDSSAPDLERFFKVLEEAFHNSSDQLEVNVEDVSWCIEGDHHNVEVNDVEVENWDFNSESVEKFMSLFKSELNKLVEDEDS